MARVIEVIVSHRITGKGTDESPMRRVMQLWSKDGILLAEDDPVAGSIAVLSSITDDR